MIYIYEEDVLDIGITDAYFSIHHCSFYKMNKEILHTLIDNIHGKYTTN